MILNAFHIGAIGLMIVVALAIGVTTDLTQAEAVADTKVLYAASLP